MPKTNVQGHVCVGTARGSLGRPVNVSVITLTKLLFCRHSRRKMDARCYGSSSELERFQWNPSILVIWSAGGGKRSDRFRSCLYPLSFGPFTLGT